MQQQSNSQLNRMTVEYEEIGMENVSLDVEITSEDIADFILKRQFKHGTEDMKGSRDFATRLIGSSFGDCIKEFEAFFGIKDCVGWYEIVEESHEFYEYMKCKHRKEALAKTSSIHERRKQ